MLLNSTTYLFLRSFSHLSSDLARAELAERAQWLEDLLGLCTCGPRWGCRKPCPASSHWLPGELETLNSRAWNSPSLKCDKFENLMKSNFKTLSLRTNFAPTFLCLVISVLSFFFFEEKIWHLWACRLVTKCLRFKFKWVKLWINKSKARDFRG